MKKIMIILAVMGIMMSAPGICAENETESGSTAHTEQSTETQQRNIVVFAVGSELVWAHDTVYNVFKRSLVYNDIAYIPLDTILEAYGGSYHVSDGRIAVSFRGKNYIIEKSDTRTYNDMYFVKARHFTNMTGLLLSWHDGLIVISDCNAQLLSGEEEFYKEKLEYKGYTDLYLEEQYVNTDKLVEYSVEGGFFTQPQSVELKTNLRNADIYYTYDGSDPVPGAEHTFLYTEPIYIGNTSYFDNSLCNIEHVVNENFTLPMGTVMKAVCLKARAFDKDDFTNMSKMSVNSYYIADDIFTRYGVKVVSITAEPDRLFNPETGIYTYSNSTELSNWREVGAYMEVFDSQGQRVIHQPIGLRLNGAGTRVFQQKALRIYARENGEYENGKKKKFKYDFFDGKVLNANGAPITEYKRIILRNSGDDWDEYFCRDVLVHDICKNAGIDTQGYSLSVVFLNGEYWGVHKIRERYDDKYLEAHYELSNDKDAAIVEIASNPMLADLSEGTEEDLEDFNSKAYFVINNDMSNDEMYAKAESYFDMGNMIDYYIFNVYFENVDWPQNNVKLWRNKNPENTQVDTRWRFLLTDDDTTCQDNGKIYEEALGKRSEKAAKWKGTKAKGTLGYKLDDSDCLCNRIIKSLMKNNNFKIEFIRRYNDYLNTILKPWNVTGHMDTIYNEMIHLRGEHIYRYPLSWKQSTLNDLKKWAQERPAKARKEIANYFGYKSTVNVTFKCNQDQGALAVNALLIDEKSDMGIENAWEYRAPYYKNLPIWFRVIPNTGYQLDYFTVNGEVYTDLSCVFTPVKNTVVEVFFKSI